MSEVAKHVEGCGCLECEIEVLTELDRLRVEDPAAFEEATKHFTHCISCRSINIERRMEPVPHRHYRHCNACGRDTYLSEPLAGLTHAVGRLEAEVQRTAAIPRGPILPREPDTSGCCYQKPGGCERHRTSAPTPAAMLGEALELLERAHALALAAYDATPGTMLSRDNGSVLVANTRQWMEWLKRDAEGRKCPHCGNPTNFRDAHLCVKRESP